MTDLFLYHGESNPNDIKLTDPTQLSGGVSGTATVTGVEAVSAIGIVTATGVAAIAVSGVSSTAAVGTVIAKAAAVIAVTGVGAAASVGSVVAQGGATATVTGVAAASSIGTVIAVGDHGATVAVTGVEAVASIGQVIASGDLVAQTNTGGGAGPRRRKRGARTYALERPREYPAIVFPDGVACAAAVGRVLAFGGATAMPDTASVVSQIGDVHASGVQNLTDEELLLLLAAA